MTNNEIAHLIAERDRARLERDIIGAARAETEAQRDEMVAKVQWLADHITALDVSTVKAPGLVSRLRAIVAEATR